VDKGKILDSELSGTILFVDDDPDFRESMFSVFKKHDLSVIWSESITDTRFRLSNQQFDLVILDVRIKQGISERLVMGVRDDLNSPNHLTPFLIISGSMEPKIINSLKEDADGFMVKPIDEDALVGKMRELIGKRRKPKPRKTSP
jgi:DNA-binding NtrC family response regulator